MNDWRDFESELADLRSWRDANSPNAFDISDYIHAKVSQDALPVDVVVAVAQLFWPEFSRIEGQVVLTFRSDKFREYREQGLEPISAARSANCLSLDGLLPNALMTTTEKLARQLESAWTAKLEHDVLGEGQLVKVFIDNELGDVLISISAA